MSRKQREFRAKFKSELEYCLSLGISPIESFGVIWEKLSEEIWLTEAESKRFFQEMASWAKALVAKTQSAGRKSAAAPGELPPV